MFSSESVVGDRLKIKTHNNSDRKVKELMAIEVTHHWSRQNCDILAESKNSSAAELSG
ncbi:MULTISPECIES: hypothetical protein [Pseudanabaena]|uniref:Uncharacterized protein n=1 Tax=Pseudanabaena catenata USMAC16 TaxID=1855837 RepID=A0A9X4RGH2_9CYAN|nr:MULTISPECIES: hypothetical protein [Pseudanabaena]MDG3493332.1 hypothetical protein [Pseudanabaena catenata USMAC16]